MIDYDLEMVFHCFRYFFNSSSIAAYHETILDLSGITSQLVFYVT